MPRQLRAATGGARRFGVGTVFALSCTLISPVFGRCVAGAADERTSFPSKLATIDGAQLDLQARAGARTQVVVTVKAPWCPVCHEQLVRIKERIEELGYCGLDVLVLVPGPVEQARKLRDSVGLDVPFVVDGGLEIARSLGLELSESEMVPAILMLRHDLTVGWMQRGRNARYFGDPELMKAVGCWERLQT